MTDPLKFQLEGTLVIKAKFVSPGEYLLHVRLHSDDGTDKPLVVFPVKRLKDGEALNIGFVALIGQVKATFNEGKP